MTFHDVRFPTDLSFGSVGGPQRRTDVVTLANGFEERNTPWSQSRRRFDAGLGVRSLDDLATLLAFFEARRGRLYGFRWKDWTDWTSSMPSQSISATDQAIGIGDGAQTAFQLTKAYASGGHATLRDIRKPVQGTVVVALDGSEVTTGWTLDADTGIVTFDQAPAQDVEITAGFAFDVPVRFDEDRLDITAAAFDAGAVPDVPVVELRV